MPINKIANDLGISRNTIDNHLTNIYSKLSVKNKTHAVVKFMKNTEIDII